MHAKSLEFSNGRAPCGKSSTPRSASRSIFVIEYHLGTPCPAGAAGPRALQCARTLRFSMLFCPSLQSVFQRKRPSRREWLPQTTPPGTPPPRRLLPNSRRHGGAQEVNMFNTFPPWRRMLNPQAAKAEAVSSRSAVSGRENEDISIRIACFIL